MHLGSPYAAHHTLEAYLEAVVEAAGIGAP
jgi:hypothetical protein